MYVCMYVCIHGKGSAFGMVDRKGGGDFCGALDFLQEILELYECGARCGRGLRCGFFWFVELGWVQGW